MPPMCLLGVATERSGQHETSRQASGMRYQLHHHNMLGLDPARTTTCCGFYPLARPRSRFGPLWPPSCAVSVPLCLAAQHPLTFNGATCAPSRFTGAKRDAVPTCTGGTAPCLVAERSASPSSQSERRRPSRCVRSPRRFSACWRPPGGRAGGEAEAAGKIETAQSTGHLDRTRLLPDDRLDVGSIRPVSAALPAVG
jgi:hypothetical protein